MRSSVVALAVALAPLGLAACDSQPEYCSEKEEAQASFDALRDTNVVEDGSEALREQFGTFTTDMRSFIDAAGDEFDAEIDAVQNSLREVQTAVDGAGDDVAAAAQEIAPALQGLFDSSSALLQEVDDVCN
jgi:hypothetical protein